MFKAFQFANMMKMLGKSFSALFLLQIILLFFAVKYSTQFKYYKGKILRVNGENDGIEPTNGEVKNNEQMNGKVDGTEPSNTEDKENQQVNEANDDKKQSNEQNGSEKSNFGDGGSQQLSQDSVKKETKEEDGEIEQSNGDDNGKEKVKTEDSNDNKDLLVQLNQFEERKPAIWKLPQPMHEFKKEPGFDLTPEEMEKFKIWKNGVIPYYIDMVSYGDHYYRGSMWFYLKLLNDVTGLTFMQLETPPTNNDERWVFFINRRGLLGCADHDVKNFTTKGVQQVVLGYDCVATKGEVAEAVMSILGIPAQHNAPDRDKYIQVNMENIIPEKRHLFEKLRDDEWLFHDLEYDVDSITHYDIHRYSVNGRATIEPKGSLKELKPGKTFSDNDYLKIKMLYNYILHNRKIVAPECQKLFKPRNKYDRFIIEPKPVQPRKKPNRYLGLPDNKVNDDESKEQAGKEENNNEKDKEENETEEQNEDKAEEQNENEAEKQNEEENKSDTDVPPKQKLMGKKLDKVDALALYSDYDTSIENQKRKLKYNE